MDCPDFVEWKEKAISQERGSRVVHYYLNDSSGKSHLAVIGTERSLRHMFYAISPEFCQQYGADLGLKWRSRREVVDWLTSVLSRPADAYQDHSGSLIGDISYGLGTEMERDGFSISGSHLLKTSNLKCHNSDIAWSGSSWTCGKQLRHYGAFCRNGTTISARSFVLVMSEGETRYLAYLEDMYEDRKGQKKVKVRWFHQNQEFGCSIPPPIPHLREVFITPYLQVISAECVDDHATVLTPVHYDQLLAALPDTSAAFHLCFRQYIKNRFKPFDLSSLSGYYDQAALTSLNICSPVGVEDDFPLESTIKHCGPKKIRIVRGHQNLLHMDSRQVGENKDCRLVSQTFGHGSNPRKPFAFNFSGPFSPLFKVGHNIELLCQDSGIRGCWFKCTVLQLSQKQLKVQYHDVQNEDDSGNLEEWIPAFKVVAPDKLGMRHSGRLTIRPYPLYDHLPDDVALSVGTPIDAWWNDGWWEGIVVGLSSFGDDNTRAYFPGEGTFLVCQRKNLRISRDWVGNQWIDIDRKPDILSSISSHFSVTNQPLFSAKSKGAESGGSAMSVHEAAVAWVDPLEGENKNNVQRGQCPGSDPEEGKAACG